MTLSAKERALLYLTHARRLPQDTLPSGLQKELTRLRGIASRVETAIRDRGKQIDLLVQTHRWDTRSLEAALDRVQEGIADISERLEPKPTKSKPKKKPRRRSQC